jgi:predicted peroxiredoxin
LLFILGFILIIFNGSIPNHLLMKKLLFVIIILLFVKNGYSQILTGCEGVTAFSKSSSPDLGIVIYSGDAETVWNALRLATFSQSKGDSVVIFVVGKALDIYMNDTSKFKIDELCDKFLRNGGDIYACATCAKQRHTEEVPMCTITSIGDLYEIVKRSKKVLTF